MFKNNSMIGFVLIAFVITQIFIVTYSIIEFEETMKLNIYLILSMIFNSFLIIISFFIYLKKRIKTLKHHS